jgi:ferredoxin
MPAFAGAVQRCGRRSMGEPVVRVYGCRRCGECVRVCSVCDRGQVFCAAECAKLSRRESLRRAGARYQSTRRGAHCHAARQRRWRQRHHPHPAPQIVTHQPCAALWATCTVSAARERGEPSSREASDNNNRTIDSVVTYVSGCDFCRRRRTPPGTVSEHGVGVAPAGPTLRGTS